MIKNVLKEFVPAAKWLAVVGATAAVVISIQVNADGSKADAIEPAFATTADGAKAEKAALLAPSKNWSPASGFADLIESVNPAVVHVSTSGYVNRRSGSRRGQPNLNDPREFFRRFFEGTPLPDYPDEEPEQTEPEAE